MNITELFAHVSDEDKDLAVKAWVKANPQQNGIDFYTMMDNFLDSDSHLHIVGDIRIEAPEASKIVRHFIQAGRRGWYHMFCFNGLSEAQQTFLIDEGYLPIGYEPEGPCMNGAEVAIERENDKTPGPRFYCRTCAIDYLRPTRQEVIDQIKSELRSMT